jgi:hypothetical protein
MTTKTITKTKRVIIDYSQNNLLEDRINSLSRYYSGMSNAEIVKLAIINFHNQMLPVRQLTDEEEESLALSMSDKSPMIKMPKGANAAEFILNYNFEE